MGEEQSAEAVVDTLRLAAVAVRSHADPAERVRALQAAQDAIEAAKVAALAELDDTQGYRDEGCSTIGAWVRTHLRLRPQQSRDLLAASRTLNALPDLADAATRGQVRVDHVASFTYGLRHIGAEVMEHAQEFLLAVATTADPATLQQVVRALRQARYPDSLDEAWVKGMDKIDLQVNPVPDGWHLTGFLDIATGAKLDTIIKTASKPRGADDTRTGAQRRVAALDTLLDTLLAHGVPTATNATTNHDADADHEAEPPSADAEDPAGTATGDTTDVPAPSDVPVRPVAPAHLSVLVDADTLAESLATTHPDLVGLTPADLTGFGPIGGQLLSFLACGADLSPLLMKNAQPGDFTPQTALDHGHTKRYATPKQRRLITAQQHGHCGNTTCHHGIDDIHHITWACHGGPTDLTNLIGLCRSCHTLVHQGKLVLTVPAPRQLTLTTADGRPLADRLTTPRQRSREIRQIITATVPHPRRDKRLRT